MQLDKVVFQLPSLEANTFLHVRPWIKQVRVFAKLVGTTITPNGQGLLDTGIVSSDVQWTAEHAILTGNAAVPGVIPPRLVPVHPGNPPAAAAGQFLWKYQMKLFVEFVQAEAILKFAILSSLGPTITQEISDPVHGMLNVSIVEIINYISLQYLTPRDIDVAQLHQSLLIPFNDPALFRQQSAELYEKFELLAEYGQPKSTYEQILTLTMVTSAIPSIAAIIQQQKAITPSPITLTFAQVTAYINAHLTVATPISTFGYTAAAAVPTPPQKTKRQPSANYCYMHGWGHSGDHCFKMPKDPKYTAAMIAATKPTDVAGGSTAGTYAPAPSKGK